jgi:hypothetical protein
MNYLKSDFTPFQAISSVLRWIALHKLWLADKPERRFDKKDKDRRQGTVLLDATSYFLQASHPLNVDFVLDLPAELRHHFYQGCASSGFIPAPSPNPKSDGIINSSNQPLD